MKSFFKNRISFIIAVSVFLFVTAILLVLSLDSAGGKFVYPLDDAYIHLSVARNLAAAGTWGINPGEFAPCSSSPLWTLILSFVFVFSESAAAVPFVLNILFAIVLLYLCGLFLERYIESRAVRTVVLLAVVFFTPLTSLVFTGLEHTLFILVLVLILNILGKNKGAGSSSGSFLVMLFLFQILVSLRYEGLFFALPLAVYFLLEKKPLKSLAVLSASLIPAAVMGIVSIGNGWYFLPSSVLIKSDNFGMSFTELAFSFFSPEGLGKIASYHNVLLVSFLLIAYSSIVFFRKQKHLYLTAKLSIVLMAGIFLQAKYAKFGYFSRYEAYIITAGILLVSVMMFGRGFIEKTDGVWYKNKMLLLNILSLILIVLVFFPAAYRAVKNVPVAVKNIYEQQYQMAGFINKFYKNGKVAVNDIGAVSYYGGAEILDIWGLSDIRFASAVIRKIRTGEFIEKICSEEQINFAVIYDPWFNRERGGIPSSWILAERWKISHNKVCGDSIITFYAPDSVNHVELKKNLLIYRQFLPDAVEILTAP